jgi:hypothetical protein
MHSFHGVVPAIPLVTGEAGANGHIVHAFGGTPREACRRLNYLKILGF